MAYRKIVEFLKKFEGVLAKGTFDRDMVKQTIEEVAHIPLDLKDIKIEAGDIFLNVRGMAKSEILLHKEKILTLLKERTGKTFSTIR